MQSATTAPQPSPSTSGTTSYYNYNRDCSQPICSTICLQWCSSSNTYNFPGPPPPMFADVDSGTDDSSSSRISPLMIALISVLIAAFLLLSYYTFAYKLCKRRRSRWSQSEIEEDLQLQARLDQLVLQDNSTASVHYAVNSNGGLDDSFIRSITVFKYKRGDGLVESTDCAVCLTEFKDDENLRLMPNCQHAFHPPCIDTWLRSHSNCPICRSSMIGAPPPPPPPPPVRPQAPTAPPATVVSRMRVQRPGDVVVVIDDLDLRRDVSPAPVEGDVDLVVVEGKERGMSNH